MECDDAAPLATSEANKAPSEANEKASEAATEATNEEPAYQKICKITVTSKLSRPCICVSKATSWGGM